MKLVIAEKPSVFGGGEPLLQAKYIRDVCRIMSKKWKVRIEISLNVYWELIEMLTSYVDEWIVDIKDSNNEIYKEYIGVDGRKAYDNVCKLSEKVGPEKITIRIPEIPEFNNNEDIKISMDRYSKLGKIDLFQYRQFGSTMRNIT